jgi:hypothetical protein
MENPCTDRQGQCKVILWPPCTEALAAAMASASALCHASACESDARAAIRPCDRTGSEGSPRGTGLGVRAVRLRHRELQGLVVQEVLPPAPARQRWCRRRAAGTRLYEVSLTGNPYERPDLGPRFGPTLCDLYFREGGAGNVKRGTWTDLPVQLEVGLRRLDGRPRHEGKAGERQPVLALGVEAGLPRGAVTRHHRPISALATRHVLETGIHLLLQRLLLLLVVAQRVGAQHEPGFARGQFRSFYCIGRARGSLVITGDWAVITDESPGTKLNCWERTSPGANQRLSSPPLPKVFTCARLPVPEHGVLGGLRREIP